MMHGELSTYRIVENSKNLWKDDLSTGGFKKPKHSLKINKSKHDTDDLRWWQKIDTKLLKEDLEDCGIYHQDPTEQYIIGRNGVGIRFYNYGDRLPTDIVSELRAYVDVSSQWLGSNQARQLISDVIITPIKNSERSDGLSTVAFQRSELPGVVFVDSDGVSNRKDGDLCRILLHELGHKLHGSLERDEVCQSRIAQLALKAGWDLNSLKSSDWVLSSSENAGDYRANRPNEFLSQYGATHPLEAFAEISSDVMSDKTDVRDGELGNEWLKFMYDEGGYTLASDYPYSMLYQERKTGKNILYPRSTRRIGKVAILLSRFR